MIWIVFGAMAVATFLAVGQILVESDPAHARRQIRLAALAVWVFGLVLTLLGKPLYGLTLMGFGALGVFAAPRPKRRSAPSEAHRRGRPAGRRPDFEGDAHGRSGEVRLDPGVMTEEQAYQILGVQPGASAEEVSRAHRSLMKKIHPDQGGSTDLAALANAAKDFLSKRRHD